MSAFTQKENPVGRYLENGIDFQLCQNLVYSVGKEDSLEIILVPEGSVTDFASIPAIFQILLPKSIGRRAAIIHDYLYRTGGLGGFYTRQRCDEIFKEALIVLSVPKHKVDLLYTGVRLGGWKTWNRYIKQQKQQHEDRPSY